MSDSWYKVDNVAKVFLATASQRDPRVFRISCTLNEEIDPDTLNEALRSTAQEWPQFQVTLHRGLFWHYFESTDQLPTAQPENKAPCAVLRRASFSVSGSISSFNVQEMRKTRGSCGVAVARKTLATLSTLYHESDMGTSSSLK